MDKILVIVAHPDDEVLGCGGTIARHSDNGDKVHVICMTNGVGSRNSTSKEIKDRKSAALDASKKLGVNSTIFLDFPDNKMDSVPLLDIIQSIESVTKGIDPKIIYTHHYGDLNVDHQITHKAVMTAFRPTPLSSVKEIYTFEVMSSTDWNFSEKNTFNPNYFIEITNYIDVKISALDSYKMELRDIPHSRSISHIDALAKFRGNTVGVDMAEAFMVLRKLI
jgi:N-acetylglucosamine malate deacetylase 1